MRARISDRVPPGVVYTTFHFPISGANVVTTEYSDWATNCPEYKVTAVQVRPSQASGSAPSPQALGLVEHTGSHQQDVLRTLVRMANQIAANNDHRGQDKVDAIARHLRQFWTPRMRTELQEVAEVSAARSDQDPLDPCVRSALALLPH